MGLLMKNEIRAFFLKKRKELPNIEVQKKSDTIKENVFSFPRFIKAKNAMFFISIGKEPSTQKMIARALKQKIVLAPKIFGEALIPCELSPTTNFVKGQYNVLEPVEENFFPTSKIDIIFVPGLAFTENGDRIEFGKGYFDRFLAKTTAYKVGLCFDEFITKKLPTDEYDIKMDAVITDKRVIVVNK